MTSGADGVPEHREKVLRRALVEWGEDLQIDIAIEELSELTTELARRQRGREKPSSIQEEIADVQLCLDQLKMMYGQTQVAEQQREKLERLEGRLASTDNNRNEEGVDER